MRYGDSSRWGLPSPHEPVKRTLDTSVWGGLRNRWQEKRLERPVIPIFVANVKQRASSRWFAIVMRPRPLRSDPAVNDLNGVALQSALWRHRCNGWLVINRVKQEAAVRLARPDSWPGFSSSQDRSNRVQSELPFSFTGIRAVTFVAMTNEQGANALFECVFDDRVDLVSPRCRTEQK